MFTDTLDVQDQIAQNNANLSMQIRTLEESMGPTGSIQKFKDLQASAGSLGGINQGGSPGWQLNKKMKLRDNPNQTQYAGEQSRVQIHQSPSTAFSKKSLINVSNSLEPAPAQGNYRMKKQPVNELKKRFERKRIMSPGASINYNQSQTAHTHYEGSIMSSQGTAQGVRYSTKNSPAKHSPQRQKLQFLDDSIDISSKQAKPSANFMPLVGQKGGEAITKVTHRWKHIGRGNDRSLSPNPNAHLLQPKPVFRDRKQEKNMIINKKHEIEKLIGLASSTDSQLPTSAKKKETLPPLHIRNSMQDFQNATLPSEGARVLAEELTKSEETWNIPKQLPARKFDMLQTGMSPMKVPIDSPAPRNRNSLKLASSMTSQTGPGGMKKFVGKRSTAETSSSPKKTSFTIGDAFRKARNEVMKTSSFGTQDLAKLAKLDSVFGHTTQKSVATGSMYSAQENARPFDAHAVIAGGNVIEQFYAAAPEVIRLSLQQNKKIEQIFNRSPAMEDVDALLIALANIGNIKQSQYVDVDAEDKKKLEKMLQLLLGQNQPNVLVRNISRKLNKRMYSRLFSAFTDDSEGNIFNKFAREIKDKRNYLELCKRSNQPCVTAQNQENQMLRYFQKCKSSKVSPLPILFKIVEGKLRLENYTLNKEVTKSLAIVCEQFPDILHSIHFNRNGMKDEEMALLIQALGKLNRCNSIILKHNEFGEESFKALLPILQKPIGDNLQELRLVSCHTNSVILEKMLDTMGESCFIQKLGIVQAKLTNAHMDEVIKIISKNRFLQELDLSWNELNTSQMLALTGQLAENRTLQYVNLSWNYLTGGAKGTQISINEEDKHISIKDHVLKSFTKKNQTPEERKESERKTSLELARISEIIDEPNFEQDGQTVYGVEKIDAEVTSSGNFKAKLIIYQTKLDIIEERDDKKKHNAQIVQNLMTFIKRNRKLLHLNLDNTQLSEMMLFKLSCSLTRAPSLLVFHASGNPGNTQELREIVWRRIRCIDPTIEKNKMDFEKVDKKEDWRAAMTVHPQREKMLKESMEVRAMSKRAQCDGGMTEFAAKYHSNQYVFTRYLGHKPEIPGAAQWKLLDQNDKCWICENYIYTVFFWSTSTGWATQKDQIGMEEEEIAQKVEDIQVELGADPNKPIPTFEVPHVCSVYSNWKPTPMMPLKDFCAAIDRTKPNFLEELQNEGKIKNDLQTMHDLTSREQNYLSTATRLHFEGNYNYSEEVIRTLQDNIRWRNMHKIDMDQVVEHGKRYLQDLKKANKIKVREELQKKQQAIDSDDSDAEAKKKKAAQEIGESDDEEAPIPAVYVYPIFCKPGRQTFLIGNGDPEEDENKYYLHKTIAPQRIDPVPPFNKPHKTLIKTRVFEKHNSVFRDWKEDSEQTIRDCFEHDFECWKLKGFVKDVQEQEKIQAIMIQEGEFLKQMFIQQAAKSNAPLIGRTDISQFFQHKLLVCDKVIMPPSNLDLQYTGVTSNAVKFEPKPNLKISGMLCRFEFMEFVVRVAIARFTQKNSVTSSVSEALQMLLSDFLIENYHDQQWSYFRSKKLWTLDVNDCYYANKDNMQELLRRYYEPRKKTFTMKDANTMFVIEADCSIAVQDVNYSWMMSKMTIVSETKNYQAYDDIKLVEFYEFFARLADCRFPGEAFDTTTKIEMLMDLIFKKLLGRNRNEVTKEVEEESESDDDY